MLYEPKKVFVLKNKKYFEISYAEYCEKAQTEFKNKFFIPLHGSLMEVIKEVHDEFKKNNRHERYVQIRSLKRELYYQSLDMDYFSGEEILPNPDEDVCDKVIDKIMAEQIKEIISKLPLEEQELMDALFFKGYSEREWSRISDVPQKTINDRKHKILEKIKNFLKN